MEVQCKMKRFISLLLVLVLLTSVVVGCTTNEDDTTEETPNVSEEDKTEDDDSEEDVSEGEVAEGEIVKLGLGQVISIGKSEDSEDDKPATGQADVTMAAVGFDTDDKVASVTIDTVQSKVDVDEEGKIESDINEEVDSKKVLKEDYNMKGASEIDKEWYEQIEALEEWMIGKTVEEIAGMESKEDGDEIVPDEEELTSSVTIVVNDYIEVVSKAWDNAIEIENGSTAGLGSKTILDGTKDGEDNKPAVVAADTTMTATAFDSDGDVAGTIIDVVQIEIEVEDGKIITDKDEEILTKHELEDDYGMKKASDIDKEWYEQAEALQEWMVGKSVSEIVEMDVTEKDESHVAVPDEEELTSSVTITVEDYLEVVQRASDNAK